MIRLAHLKRRLGQYGALWVGAFLLSGAAILIGMMFADLMAAVDVVLPVMLAGVALALGAGVVMSLWSDETVGTKGTVVVLALLLGLPLLWAPVSAAVAIAFFAGRAIEYSGAYAAFQIGVSRVLFPLGQAVFGGDVFGRLWGAFQWVASVVGFVSALSNVWPIIRRLLGPDAPAEVDA